MSNPLNKELQERQEESLAPHFVNYHDNKHRAESQSSKTQLISTAIKPLAKDEGMFMGCIPVHKHTGKINTACA